MDEKHGMDETLFAIQFDIPVNRRCLDIICDRAEQLFNAAADIESWRETRYGKLFTFADAASLTAVRQYWSYYRTMSNRSEDAHTELFSKFMKEFLDKFLLVTEDNSDTAIVATIRAMGSTFPEGWAVAANSFVQFWTDGTIGEMDFDDEDDYINPLFISSTNGNDHCSVHHYTHPIFGFHCASVFVDLIPRHGGPYSDHLTPTEKLQRLCKSVKARFKKWCRTFTSIISQNPGAVSICVFSGDALRFCYSMQNIANFNFFDYYSAPWTPPIILEECNKSSYGPFDVIETFDLADRIDLPIVLISTLPLLKNSAQATLYTSTLVSPDPNVSLPDKMKSLLWCEPVTFFILFAAAPMEYLTGMYNVSSIHELKMGTNATSDERDWFWKFSWKRWLLPHSVGRFPHTDWEPTALAKVLHDIYFTMFRGEDINDDLSKVHCADVRSSYPLCIARCTRSSFAAFVNYLRAQHQVRTDWSTVIEELINLIRSNDRTMSEKNLADFFFQLFVHKVLDTPSHCTSPLDLSSIQVPNGWAPVYHTPESLPSVLPFIIKVPRKRLRPVLQHLKSGKPEKDHPLQVHVFDGRRRHIFSSLEVAFGKMSDPTNLQSPSIQRDKQGWRGKGDLFVHVNLPLHILFTNSSGAETKVFICFRHDASIGLGPEIMKLGEDFTILETNLSDISHIWPVLPRHLIPFSKASNGQPKPNSTPGRVHSYKISNSLTEALQLIIRIELNDESDHAAFLAANLEDFSVQATSGCEIEFRCGSFTTRFPVPFSVRLSHVSFQHAKNCEWIELIMPFTEYTDVVGLRFPITRADSIPLSWNLPRVFIDAIPKINLSTTNNLFWIMGGLKSILWGQNQAINSPDNAMQLFKGGLIHVLSQAVGWKSLTDQTRLVRGGPKVYVFYETQNAPPIMVLFITSVKLDYTGDNIVADAHILLFTSDVQKELIPDINKLAASLNYENTADEFKVWKQYIKASIERTRDWRHSENCNNSERWVSDPEFLCDCGLGKVSPEFKAKHEWDKFIPYVTRFALTPIFPVTFFNPTRVNNPRRPSARQKHSTSAIGSDECCWVCKAAKDGAHTLKKCARCQNAIYCSIECQQKDWVRHKKADCRK